MANHPNRGKNRYKIVVARAGLQKLVDNDPYRSACHARIVNTHKGWMAHRGNEQAGDDPEPMNVSRWINDPAGPAKIAELLGISK